MLDHLTNVVGSGLVPVVVILLAIGFVLTVKFIASRYKKVAPNMAGIFYGRKYHVKIGERAETMGFMVLLGGGRVLMPLVESYREMSTAAFQVPINENNIPNRDNVKFVINGVATCKISTIPENLYRAAGAFLDKSEEEIEEFIRNILKGHLRSIVGKLDINSLLREREDFNRKVIAESAPELAALGMELVNLVIQEITDAQGYIDALGEQAVAETKRTAAIAVAEANRDRDIAVSNAEQLAAATRASNQAKVAEAERDRDVKVAEAKTASENARAVSDRAFAIASAAQDQILRVAEAQRDAAEKEAQIEVQAKEALRKERELDATIVQTAKAEKQKKILEAEAAASVKTTEADAEKKAEIARGEGEASKLEATLTAKAKGEAEGKRQALLAEAEGMEKLAKSLREMSDASRLLMLLDKLPPLIEHGGDAAAKVASAIFSSVAAPLGQIDNVSIVDMGGSGRGLDQMSSIVPRTVFNFLASAKAAGIDIGGMLQKLGIDPSKAMEMLNGGKTDVALEVTPVLVPEPPAPESAPEVKVEE